MARIEIGKLIASLRAETAQFKREMRGVRSEFAIVGKSVKKLTAAFGITGGAAAVGTLARSVFRTGVEFEELRARLKTVTGSAQAATREFKRIQDFAIATPFQVQNLTDAFVRLSAFGLEPTETLLRDFGNLAAAFGRDITDLTRAVTGLATGETEAIKSFGIVARVQGDQIRLTFDGVTKTIERDTDAIVSAISEISQSNFATAMSDRMQTLSGQISNLQDAFGQLADTIVTKIAPATGNYIDLITRLIGKFTELVRTGEFPAILHPQGVVNFALRRLGVGADLQRLADFKGKAKRGIIGEAPRRDFAALAGTIGLRLPLGPATLFGLASRHRRALFPRVALAEAQARAPRGLAGGPPEIGPDLSALGNTLQIRGLPALTRFRREIEGLQTDFSRATKLTPMLGAAIVQTVGGAIQSLIGGRGGGVLGAITGGIAGFLTGGPVFGALGALPGLIQAFKGTGNQPQPVQVIGPVTTREETQRPLHVTLQIQGATGDTIGEIVYRIDEYNRNRGTTRVLPLAPLLGLR